MKVAPTRTTSGESGKFDPRSIAAPGEGLADLFPDLYQQAVRCPKYPKLPLARLKTRSNLALVWRCLCGNETERKVNNITIRGRVICDRCRASGKSRLEYEIAEILRIGLHTEVRTHYGDVRFNEVDIYFPALDTAVEIDPYRTHRDRADHDRRRLEHHADSFSHVFRVRQEGLPEILGCPTVPRRASALDWARTIAANTPRAHWTEPTLGEVRIAIASGAAAYFALIQSPPRRALAQRPEVASELVENLDVPGQLPEWIPLGSGAMCMWACPVGHADYRAPVARRTGPQATGCPQCGFARVARVRRRPPIGGSAADVHTEIVDFFIDNLTSPDSDLTEVRPSSHDRCRWRCARSNCDRVLMETVKGRAARPGAVCGDCRADRVWDTRHANPDDPVNQRWATALRALDAYIGENGHARIAASFVTADGFPLGAWVLQTRKRRADLTPGHLADLAARTPWVWSAKDDAWWRAFSLLQQFAETEGHTRVPPGHRESGMRLDAFVAKQRQRYHEGLLAGDRVAALEALPDWVWRTRRRRKDARRA